MLNVIKGLFIYKEDDDKKNEFELLESEAEFIDSNKDQSSNGAEEKDSSNTSMANEVKAENVKNQKSNGNADKKVNNKNIEGNAEKYDNSKDSTDDKRREESKKQESNFGKEEEPHIIKPLPIEKMVNESKNKNSEKAKKRKTKDEEKEKNEDKSKEDTNNSSNSAITHVSSAIDDNINQLKGIFHIPKNQDVIIREFNINKSIQACIVFVDGMIDKNTVIQFILPQLMDVNPFENFKGDCPLDYIEKNVLTINQMVRMKKYDEIRPQILSGLTALFIDGCNECLVMESRGYEKRSISAPVTETVVQGAQEGFTENLRTNITLIRRIVKNENLITEFNPVSKTSNAISAIMYMDNIANIKIVEEVRRRVKSLDIDFIAGTGMLQQLIEDKPMMIFPQIISTERPDRVASFLMDGKVVVLCEGVPFVSAMPVTFYDLLHTSEDSNLKWQYGTFLRIIRLAGLILALMLPGLYTALILYHQEMIPTSLLASIVISRAPVPFPTIIEILLMEFSFELIREGGIRVPGVTGNTLGIIGALILGQAAVQAGLVSPILIIIVAVSGLGSFAIPNYHLSLAIRMLRFFLIILGYIAGLYGLSIGFTVICALTLNMKSFGVPFFAPFSPKTRSNMDVILKGPIYNLKYRPDYLGVKDRKRMSRNPRGWTKE